MTQCVMQTGLQGAPAAFAQLSAATDMQTMMHPSPLSVVDPSSCLLAQWDLASWGGLHCSMCLLVCLQTGSVCVSLQRAVLQSPVTIRETLSAVSSTSMASYSKLSATTSLPHAAVEELHLLDRDYFRFLRRLVEASPRVCAARKLRRTEPSPAKSCASVAAAPAAPPASGTPQAGPLAEGAPTEGPSSPAVAAGSGADAGAAAGPGPGRLGAGSGGGAVSMSGVSGGGNALGGGGTALGGGSEGPHNAAAGGRGGAYTRTDDAERFTLGTLNLALQFLFRVCSSLPLLLRTDLWGNKPHSSWTLSY